MVKLSVIVTFYNVQQYVPDALRSLRANARSDFEFLLMDDGSTDQTPRLLEEGARTLPGARVLLQEHAGVSRLRNAGLDASEGEYLTFMDGDDWMAPGYLPQMVKAMDDLDVDFLRTDHIKATGAQREIIRVPQGRRNVALDPRACILPADRPSLVDYPNLPFGAYHRRAVERGLMRMPETLRTAEDRLWSWRMHLEAESVGVVGLMGMHYRRSVSTSLTQIGDERQLDFIRSCEMVFDMLAKDRDGDRFLPKAVRQFCALVVFHLDQIDRFEPAMARRLKSNCAALLSRVPKDVLNDVLDSMDIERSTRIRRLRRRIGARPDGSDPAELPRQAAGAATAAAALDDDDPDARDNNGSAVA
ncbi:glycosyltransferase family 2 protein [Actinacidiphila rubida]|uniref:Glycosyl transferase family 2 n=1 Tax=Actinacidiphila rubida TaxID=310780 RepID=A0A1H8MPT9_9ACTN|nr:glycosyltransferase family 2 protein [Actinacidiphila rubida]SEO19244.1 Glycosyl transferase family 2 [Actinacidiphila rubida]